MNIQYKHIRTALLLPVAALVIGASGCRKDFLDRTPEGQLSQGDLSGGSFDSQVFGVYAKMRADGFAGLPYVAVHNIRSDDADKGSSVSDGVDAENFFDNFAYTKDYWLMNNYWTDHYALINAANTVIANINAVTNPDAGTLINRAEAKWMRAYAYFDMARAFGRVPKIDFAITSAAQGNVKKVDDVNELYALIDADLTEAEGALPLSWPATYVGRLTRGAAMALHAKTYMFRSNWASALSMAKAVINSGQYRLNSDYFGIFTEAGENNIESIFEIQAIFTQTQDLGVMYANVQGVRGAGAWDLGWGWNTPNASLANAFEANDPRRTATLLFSGQSNTPYNETVPAATPDVPRPYWNKKVYTNPAVRTQTNSRFGKWMNVRVIRYADVLLWAAEAANELGGTGNTTDALNWLELVRARARSGAPAGTLPAVTTTDQSALRTAIRNERRVELGMENERFFDLVRWGTVKAVMQAAGKNFQDKNVYLPIPQPEIDKSGGVLVQNPNY